MKLTSFSFLFILGFAAPILSCGCRSHSEFDVNPAQVQRNVLKRGTPMKLDMAHLPAGAVKHEQMFHKGDTLPDGSIASGDAKVVTVEMHGAKPSEDRKMLTVDEDLKK